MSFEYYNDEAAEQSCGCDNDYEMEHRGCRSHVRDDDSWCDDDSRREKCEKEFLGRSVSECKYYRVCKKRFYEAEKKPGRNRCCSSKCRCCCCK